MNKKTKIIFCVLTIMTLILCGSVSVSARSILKAPVISFIIKASPEAGPEHNRGIHIFDYGHVLLVVGGKNGNNIRVPFPKARARKLLDYIVKDQDIFSITQTDIRAFQKTRHPYLDASTTEVRVWCRKGSHKLSVYNFSPSTKVTSAKMKRLLWIVRELETLRREMLAKAGK